MKRTLYLCHMNTNGTNDLLIANQDGEIIETVEEAAFGYPRQTRIKPDAVILHGCETIESLPIDPEYSQPDEYATFLYEVDAETLRKFFCVSPSDPRGAELDRRLLKAGIDLRKK